MRPVAIFRHFPTEGPGYFATFLESHGIAWTLIPVDAGAPIPASADAYAGLCFMGGPMSVNDPLPWIDDACALIRDAAGKGIPVLGHCLGAQLMSKALGGCITRNPVKEIGWGAARVEVGETSRHWLDGLEGEFPVFHWHGETFSLPEGAVRLLTNDYCANQMFALGPHLGMQCHVEMTPEMIASWCEQWEEEAGKLPPMPSVQTPQVMQAEAAQHLPAMRRLADQLYSAWSAGLKR